MTRRRIHTLYLLPLVTIAAACVEPSSALAPGEETAACNDGLCLDSLECRSDLCVDPDWQPPQSPAGTDDDDGHDTATTDGPSPSEPITAIDLLFVVDDSGLMGPAQFALVRAYAALTAPLLDAGLDLRVAVTTTDAGNLWCQGAGVSDPEHGSFVETSCRTRLNEFQFNGFGGPVDASATCSAHCDAIDDASFPGTSTDGPWLEGDDGLNCLLPQGVAGCGFESTLESMRRALTGTEGTQDFVRNDAHLAIVIVSNEADCSFNRGPDNQIMNDVFGADGPKTFWSLPYEDAPTSAVCWNAGVACTGSTCEPVDLDPLGNPVTDPAAASLKPVQNYVDTLASIRAQKRPSGAELFVFGLVGVPSDYDGTLSYEHGPDGDDPHSFQAQFGIGPGCTATVRSLDDENDDGLVDDQDTTTVEAVPPVRMRAVIEHPEVGGRLFSICADDFGPALGAMATAITSAD